MTDTLISPDTALLPSTLADATSTPLTTATHWSDPVIDFLTTGGPVVWILGVMSVVALTIFLIKLWQILSSGATRTGDVETSLAHWQSGEIEHAQRCLTTKRPISHVVSLAIGGLAQPHTSEERLTQELTRVAQVKMTGLRSLLRPLEVIATLAPLLGLLGTVLGMITAFQKMEEAGARVDPSVLSGGIWQALLTTAVGLSVAIPVVALHTWLERKVDGIGHQMNDAVTRVFTHRPPGTLDSRPKAESVPHVA